MHIPPLPNWNKAIDGLQDPVRWAVEYERSRLPAGAIFPRAGQVWEALHDCKVGFVVWHGRACPMGGGRTRIEQGERVSILELDDPRPIQVRLRPVRYEELEARIVSEDLLQDPAYRGYQLFVKTLYSICSPREETTYLLQDFQLVEDVA